MVCEATTTFSDAQDHSKQAAASGEIWPAGLLIPWYTLEGLLRASMDLVAFQMGDFDAALTALPESI